MTVQRLLRLLPFLLLGAAAGCTFARGDWFAEVDAVLDTALVMPPSRDAGDGWHKLDTDYQVRFDQVELGIATIDLVDFAGGAGGFDPANPPPGYSNCHNGHCHHTSGALVTYEEIEAELASQTGGASVALSLEPPETLDLLVPGTHPLPCDAGPCGVASEADVRRIRTRVTALSLAGEVRDGLTPSRLDGVLPWSAVLVVPAAEEGAEGASPGVLECEVDLRVGRDASPDVRIRLRLEPTAALLDGIDFAAVLGTGAEIDLASTRDALLANLSETPLQCGVER